MQVDKKQNLDHFIYYFAFNSLHDEKSYLAPHLEVFNPISPGKDTFYNRDKAWGPSLVENFNISGFFKKIICFLVHIMFRHLAQFHSVSS